MNNGYDPYPEALDEAVLSRAAKFGSAELADGMKGLGIKNDGCMDAAILPIDENTRVVGTAVTVETKDGDNFPIHVAIYQGMPGYVLVIDGKGYDGKAYLGDLIGGAAKAVGLNGIIVDGMVRDKRGLKEMGLPVFSRGFMQRGPSKIGPGTINKTIMCAGAQVEPGDLIVGDSDGVSVVPRERIEEVFAAAEKKLQYEEKRRVTIAEYESCKENGDPLPQLAPQWVLDMLEENK